MKAPGLLAALLLVALAGCAAHAPVGVTTLHVDGVEFMGDRAVAARWSGLGVWLSPSVLVTHSATALRASVITTGDAAAITLDRVAGYDRTSELVVLRSNRPALAPAQWSAAHAGQAVVVVGGLEPVEATVLAVVGAGPARRLVLDQDLARGLVVVDADSNAVVGLMTGAAVTRAATPADLIQDLGRSASVGAPLTGLFTLPHASAWMDVAATRDVRLGPGEALRLPWTGAPGGDVAVDIAPGPGRDPFAAALVGGKRVYWKGIAGERRTLGFGLADAQPPPPPLSILVVNTARAKNRRCATIRVGGVAWDQGLRLP